MDVHHAWVGRIFHIHVVRICRMLMVVEARIYHTQLWFKNLLKNFLLNYLIQVAQKLILLSSRQKVTLILSKKHFIKLITLFLSSIDPFY